MSKRVSFKLYSKDAAGNPIDEERLALAFQHHCQRNLGLNIDLNTIVKRVFLKYLQDNVDRAASVSQDLAKAGIAGDTSQAGGEAQTSEVVDAGGETIVERDPPSVTVEPESGAPSPLADTPADAGAVAPANG